MWHLPNHAHSTSVAKTQTQQISQQIHT